MAYLDGFVLVVPDKNMAAYRALARRAGKIWMEHGALAYHEAEGDDLAMPMMKANFPRTLKLKKGESVVFAYILYKSRKHRDAVNKKVMADARIEAEKDMPFDFKRLHCGGFKTMVSF